MNPERASIRIFLGLTEVSGFFSRLQSGFQQIGVDAVHVSLHAHRFDYASGATMPLLGRLAQWAVRQRVGAVADGRLSRHLWIIPVVVTRLMLFIWAIWRFDVFIMGAGSSFFGLRELPLLKWLGKTVIYTLHGTDARPPYIDGFFSPADYGLTPTVSRTENQAAVLAEAHSVVTETRLNFVRKVERHASFVLCAPSYAQFLSRPFVNFYAIGLPTEVPFGINTTIQPVRDTVRILHAPSHAAGKGTTEIRGVINRLKDSGLAIDYEEISGRPNIEVFEAITRCDLVIDQFYADTPMAAFPAEAAAMGRPAVVGGYFSDRAKEEITTAFLPPSAFCLPNNMDDTVARMLQEPDERRRLGEAAKGFVSNEWSSVKVAERMFELLRKVPDGWILDPLKLEYIRGIGLSENQARANVAAMIELKGVASLGLRHKPDLERRFVEFAAGQDMR
ncbi:glycosyltransferase [Hoeflea sp.]|uniref:glycosyltransferase n=1 Tax=Hoeflea sp. TaxID=1940281 RepID=UPI003A91DD66